MDLIDSELPGGDIEYYAAEDSGYHTTFTPGSNVESLDLSTDFRNQSLQRGITCIGFSPELNLYLSRNYAPLKQRNEIATDTPPRRGIKRPHPSAESVKQLTTLPTPTTLIAGQIESLEVNEDKENDTNRILPPESPRSNKSGARYIYRLKIPEKIHQFHYPITPVKRNCKSSPCRSAKKLDFTIHKLACQKQELQPVTEKETKVQTVQTLIARPNQKIDLVSLLHNNSAAPAIKNILQYLNNADNYNFCNVSNSWCHIWNLYSSKGRRHEIREYLKNVKENQENGLKDHVLKVKNSKLAGFLREIHNELNENVVKSELVSPPHSPRTNRFRKFTKSASLDSRLQLSCVRCSQPAKVTKEANGEEWVECTNITCLYQFCRACNCNRHPGKSCFRYDLNAPSPTKRKRCEYAVGTMKSRKNLRRLL